jgi:DNA-directed RNA polymerase specialized sigma24 family protein
VDPDTILTDVFPGVHRYCLRRMADPEAGEAIARDCLSRLARANFQTGPEGPRVWLFRTATRLVRERTRAESPRGSDPSAPPQDADRVREILARLEERDRTVLLLRDEGLSYTEISEVMRIQPASVGTLLVRARERFEDRLDPGVLI